MKLENQVCSRDQSIKLFELGVNLSVNNYWIKNSYRGIWYVGDIESMGYDDQGLLEESVKTFTVAELCYILHKYSTWEFVDLRSDMAVYLADILIKEIEGGHIDVKEIEL